MELRQPKPREATPTMSKVSNRNPPVNSYSPLSSPLSKPQNAPAEPANKIYIQAISVTGFHEKAYLYFPCYNYDKDSIIIQSLSLLRIQNDILEDKNIILTVKIKDSVLEFKFEHELVKENNYTLPNILIPKIILDPNNSIKNYDLTLIISNKKYRLVWNIIDDLRSEYLTLIPVEVIEIDKKIKKKPPRKYKRTINRKLYEISCQVLNIDNQNHIYIPEIIIPRKRYLSYIYFFIYKLYFIHNKKPKEIITNIKEIFGEAISPSLISRTVGLWLELARSLRPEYATYSKEEMRNVIKALFSPPEANVGTSREAAVSSSAWLMRIFIERFGLEKLLCNCNGVFCYPP